MYIILSITALLTLTGCFTKVDRVSTNYYILDYKRATENPSLRVNEPFAKTLEVLDTEVNRTYARNQLVIKENFSRVRYLPFDVWANRLSDAIPNIMVQRLKAYNIFRQVERSTGDVSPNFYLETNLMNLERIESGKPRAYLRMEFKLRDAATQRVLVNHFEERYKTLVDDKIVFLVDVYNEMIMLGTDIFAAKCRMFLEGKIISDIRPQVSESPVETFLFEELEALKGQSADGELVLRLNYETGADVLYTFEPALEGGEWGEKMEGEFGREETVSPGRYRITLGENQEITVYAEVKPKLRTAVTGEWGELIVSIIDEGRNKVRLGYDIWKKRIDEYDYYFYSSDTSVGEDDLGQKEKIWILTPGTYMIKLGSGGWNDLRDFTTVTIGKGESKLLTMVVDPSRVGNYLVGAGVLGNKELALGRTAFHKGALHGNLNLSSNNAVDQDNPVFTINISGQTENNIDYEIGYLRVTARSLYDVGLNINTDSDLRINQDDYSLKNVLLFTPFRRKKVARNFSIYGRADLSTHFFDEDHYYTSPRNIVVFDRDDNIISVAVNDSRVRTKVALFPLKLKEGAGLTYRMVMNPKVSLSLRMGYGWQQELLNRTLSLTGTNQNVFEGDSLRYDVYKEERSLYDSGIESTLVFSALNILKFLSVNSTIDVLFPVLADSKKPRFESENRFNIRLYRNISLDVKANVQYDKAKRDWVTYDLSTFLRLSLYY